jgi:hypothetical protein
MPSGVVNVALVPSPTNEPDRPPLVPAIVVTTLVVDIILIEKHEVSVTYKTPTVSNASPKGLENNTAEPVPSRQPVPKPPANVVTAPLVVMVLIALEPESATAITLLVDIARS